VERTRGYETEDCVVRDACHATRSFYEVFGNNSLRWYSTRQVSTHQRALGFSTALVPLKYKHEKQGGLKILKTSTQSDFVSNPFIFKSPFDMCGQQVHLLQEIAAMFYCFLSPASAYANSNANGSQFLVPRPGLRAVFLTSNQLRRQWMTSSHSCTALSCSR
jgi:hypothetical protein